jgi:putative flippase GtrA
MLVGSLSTVIQLGLYAFLAGSVGALLANVCAWLVSTMIGNAAHHRFTFRVAGHPGESDHLVGVLTSLAGLGLSSLVLVLLDQPTGLTGTIALVAVNAAVGALRFLALRWWLVGRVTGGAPPAALAGFTRQTPSSV